MSDIKNIFKKLGLLEGSDDTFRDSNLVDVANNVSDELNKDDQEEALDAFLQVKDEALEHTCADVNDISDNKVSSDISLDDLFKVSEDEDDAEQANLSESNQVIHKGGLEDDNILDIINEIEKNEPSEPSDDLNKVSNEMTGTYSDLDDIFKEVDVFEDSDILDDETMDDFSKRKHDMSHENIEDNLLDFNDFENQDAMMVGEKDVSLASDIPLNDRLDDAYVIDKSSDVKGIDLTSEEDAIMLDQEESAYENENYTYSIEDLEKYIFDLQQMIKEREVLQAKHNAMIENEIQRILNAIDSIKEK